MFNLKMAEHFASKIPDSYIWKQSKQQQINLKIDECSFYNYVLYDYV